MSPEQRATLQVTVKRLATELRLSASAIVDRLLTDYCPETRRSSEKEGVDSSVRNGLLQSVRNILKAKPCVAVQQSDFAEIESTFGRSVLEIIKRLSHDAHYVPSLDEYVPIRGLLDSRELLDEARKYKRQKGDETIAEADKLDDLFEARFGSP